MPRKSEIEHEDDIGIQLAAPVTPQQLLELAALGYRGPSPSTQPQAASLLHEWQRREQDGTEAIRVTRPSVN